MVKGDIDFDGWFDLLVLQLSERGIYLPSRDKGSVHHDYDDGNSVENVVDEIAMEYD